jgi:diguanylate cyclase (GGDEF)-like protein
MSEIAVQSIARVATQSFQSFSQASGAVLEALSARLSGEAVLAAQFDHSEAEYRVLDSRPSKIDALEAGLTVALDASPCFHMAADRAPRLCEDVAHDAVYGGLEFMQTRGVRSYCGVPLEMSDGNRVGSLCSLSLEPGRFGEADLEYMAVLGRILAYEWERVKRELELRRLKEEVRRQDVADPLTGVLHRRGFLEALEREWDLAQRGSMESWLVVATLEGLVAANERFGHAMGDLLIKDGARALSAVARGADIVGRVSGDQFAVILVGCKGREGADAFCERLGIALARTTGERPAAVDLAFGVQALAEAPTAVAALHTGETLAREPVPHST